jgi:hypothetical protein
VISAGFPATLRVTLIFVTNAKISKSIKVLVHRWRLCGGTETSPALIPFHTLLIACAVPDAVRK